MRRRVLDRLSYANVVATLALFIAMGGTGYALSVPRNSVGSAQLRSDSVGRSELRRNAVTSPAIRNRSLRLTDLSQKTRVALRGQQGSAGPPGPPGPTFFAAVNATGQLKGGNPKSSFEEGVGGRIIGFDRPLGDCVAAATLAAVPGHAPGSTDTPPATGHVTVASTADGRVLVRTFTSSGSPDFLPFNLVVAC